MNSSNKELKNYLHLYLGCEIIGTYSDNSGSKGYLTGITNGGTEVEIQFILEDGINVEEDPTFNTIEEVKPILRPLSDISEDEINEDDYIARRKNYMETAALQTMYLLSLHFDLFGLIESGLAIDKTKLKP